MANTLPPQKYIIKCSQAFSEAAGISTNIVHVSESKTRDDTQVE